MPLSQSVAAISTPKYIMSPTIARVQPEMKP
jgi:hypothetical protein